MAETTSFGTRIESTLLAELDRRAAEVPCSRTELVAAILERAIRENSEPQSVQESRIIGGMTIAFEAVLTASNAMLLISRRWVKLDKKTKLAIAKASDIHTLFDQIIEKDGQAREEKVHVRDLAHELSANIEIFCGQLDDLKSGATLNSNFAKELWGVTEKQLLGIPDKHSPKKKRGKKKKS